MSESGFAVIILAAGSASRFGSPKQLASFRGRPLWKWAVEAAINSQAVQVILVSNSALANELKAPPELGIIVNPEAYSGIASSIRYGVAAVRSEVGVAIIALADQPLVTASHLFNLAEKARTGLSATAYPDGSIGVPAGFSRSFFGELEQLRGDQGAKSLLVKRMDQVASVPFDAILDIDTPTELLKANQS